LEGYGRWLIFREGFFQHLLSQLYFHPCGCWF
jgi:hypothetical protein